MLAVVRGLSRLRLDPDKFFVTPGRGLTPSKIFDPDHGRDMTPLIIFDPDIGMGLTPG